MRKETSERKHLIMLQLIDIACVVKGRAILQHLDLEVLAGEIHSILGANGTGKSTLAALIMGLSGYRPTAGRVLFNGEDITSASIAERAQRGITLAWQEPARFEGLMVGDYVNLGRRRAKRDFLTAHECLRKAGLSPDLYWRRAVDATLSGGERKRVEIAAVLAMHPRLVILDEPDSGIDLLSIGKIIDLIKTFPRHGASVLLITHSEEVATIADRASLLEQGAIAHTGEPAVIARMFREQSPENRLHALAP
jgi:Fe-S cluster assembly ATP-binding protein